ncbi:uncharacterized protein LOC119288029 isoform X1 [Triticum dicoccoides]|uniref:uncharacterized protein LOC119288029 isoform X1 n=1 Tax=Triticum dicoccoides TaxID=85692 RepID=UPI00188E7B07|nr:uncharacterized protein LOC119288029 isoform X1 [Triticum dicoccoides]
MRRDGKRRGRASRSGGGHGARRSARAVVRPWPPSASAQWRDVRAACFALMPWPAWDAASCCSNPNPSIAAAAPWMGGFYNSNDVPARRRQTHKHKPGRSWRRPRRARCVAIIGTSGGCRLRRCFQEERQSALSPSIGGTPDGNQAKGAGPMVLPAQHLRAWRLTRRKRPVVSHQIMMLSTARAEDSKAVDVGYGVSRDSGSGRNYHVGGRTRGTTQGHSKGSDCLPLLYRRP